MIDMDRWALASPEKNEYWNHFYSSPPFCLSKK
jgi:hypothetical protein